MSSWIAFCASVSERSCSGDGKVLVSAESAQNGFCATFVRGNTACTCHEVSVGLYDNPVAAATADIIPVRGNKCPPTRLFEQCYPNLFFPFCVALRYFGVLSIMVTTYLLTSCFYLRIVIGRS